MDQTNKKCEITLVDELLKKYNVRAVKMVCRENIIPLIEKWSWDSLARGHINVEVVILNKLCGYTFCYHIYIDYSAYIHGEDKLLYRTWDTLDIYFWA